MATVSPTPRENRRAIWAVGAFSLITWLGTASYIEHDRAVSTYEGCVSGVAILGIFNEQQQTLADIDRQVAPNVTLPEQRALIERRVRAYEEGILPLPDCSPLDPGGWPDLGGWPW